MQTAIVTIGSKQWACSVATTSAELTQGLSGVVSMPAGQGMLFDLGSEKQVSVNAYSMLFLLGVVFISESKVVTEVVHQLDIGGSTDTVLPCRYFLEVNAGEADDVFPGNEVTITGYTPTTGSILDVMVSFMIVAMMMQMMMKAMKEVR